MLNRQYENVNANENSSQKKGPNSVDVLRAANEMKHFVSSKAKAQKKKIEFLENEKKKLFNVEHIHIRVPKRIKEVQNETKTDPIESYKLMVKTRYTLLFIDDPNFSSEKIIIKFRYHN